MNKFTPTGKKEFEVKSGKLLIADPYRLGYSEGIIEEIFQLCGTTNGESPYVSFPSGLLYSTYINKNICSDCVVFTLEDSVNNTLDFLIDQVLRKYEYYFPCDKSILKLFKKESKVSAPVDTCALLIGDASVYQVPKNERIVRPNKFVQPEDREMYIHSERDLMEDVNNQIMSIPNGKYRIEYDSDKRILALKNPKLHFSRF